MVTLPARKCQIFTVVSAALAAALDVFKRHGARIVLTRWLWPLHSIPAPDAMPAIALQ